MTYEESEDMSFQLSWVESLVKGFVSKGELYKSVNNLSKDLDKSMQGSVKTWDLANLLTQIEERMGHMEDNIGRIFKLLQHQEEKRIKIEERMGHMEDNIERIVKLIQNTKEKIPKGDAMG